MTHSTQSCVRAIDRYSGTMWKSKLCFLPITRTLSASALRMESLWFCLPKLSNRGNNGSRCSRHLSQPKKFATSSTNVMNRTTLHRHCTCVSSLYLRRSFRQNSFKEQLSRMKSLRRRPIILWLSSLTLDL